MCGLVELEGVVLAVLVEIGGEDTENGFLRQDGRINKSQEGNGEVAAGIVSHLEGMAFVPSHACRHGLPLYKSHFILMDIFMNFLKES